MITPGLEGVKIVVIGKYEEVVDVKDVWKI